jgi:hypothetical protein
MRARGLGAALCVLALAAVASADAITFEMSNVFSGSGTPSGVPKVTIDDQGTAGSVKFTFDMTDLGPSAEFITGWYFNTAVNLSAIGTFSGFTNILGYVSGISISRTFNTTLSAFKADGDGYYDWLFGFATSGSARFQDGEKFSFYYSAPGITAQTFNVLGLAGPGSNTGPFKSAIHLQGVGPTGGQSLWISEGGTKPPDGGGGGIPEPSFGLLVLLGIFGGLIAGRRTNQHQVRRPGFRKS